MLSLALQLHVATSLLTVYAAVVSRRASTRRSLNAHDVELAHLFPIPASSLWTTFPGGPSGTVLPLNDLTLNTHNELSSTRHSYALAPDGKIAMRAFYPQGSYTFGNDPKGGFSFYAKGPVDRVDVESAKEVTFGYLIFFPLGFEFQKGGKLPGLYGGDSDEESRGCSGGKRSQRCFSTRLMWRALGDGEFYTYLPPNPANEKECTVAPQSECNPKFGASVGRGAFRFTTNAWTTVTQRVRLNDVGEANGEIELWANGQSVINVSGLVLRSDPAARIRGIMFQTFFGGSNDSWASPKNQEVFMADFSIAVTQTI